MGSESSGEQAGMSELAHFEGARASRNELLSRWPSTPVWLVSELRAAFPAGPGDRRLQEAFGLWTGRNSHVGLFWGAGGWNHSPDVPARARCPQGISVRVTFLCPAGPGPDHSQCLQVGQGWGTCRQGYCGRRGPAGHVGPGEAPWPRGPWGAELGLPVWDRTRGSCAARCFVLSVHLGVGGTV